MHQLSNGVGICGVHVACIQLAPLAKDMIDLLELVYELCGTYRTKRTSASSAYQGVPLTSVRQLRDFAARNSSIKGAQSVARIIPYLADGFASPRETKQSLVLGLPRRYGGYGLGVPHMNYEVKASPDAHAAQSAL